MAIQHTDCQHEFERAWRSPFVDTSGARICRICERIEVLLEHRWISFEDYLQHRRDKPQAAE